jgi:hypothetical protein
MKKLSLGVVFFVLLILAACAQPPQPTEPENPDDLSATAFGGTGLTGLYFNNMDFTGTVATRVDTTINKSWTGNPITGIAGTTYSIRWTGQIVPAFSEEYTFYLSHTDGARLMVNGQVLVNNWKDQAQIVDSGKVTLQAGVKYDIRLEYYRNATNPSLVKLEWQSARRARQVVPQDNLFSTGSNLQTAMSALQQEPKFVALGVSINSVSAIGGLTQGSAFGLSIREVGNQGVLYSTIDLSASKVTSLMRHSSQNNQVTSSDVLSGRSVTIDNFKNYFNADGTITDENWRTLKYKFAALLLDTAMIEALKQYDVPSGTLRSQAAGPTGYCADCQQQVADLVAALGEFGFGVTVEIGLGIPQVIEEVLNPPKTAKEVVRFIGDKVCDEVGSDCAVLRDVIARDALGLASTLAEKYTDAVAESITEPGGFADQVKQCVYQSQNCKPEIVGENVVPRNPKIKPNESVNLSLGFANKPTAKWGLDYTVTITNVAGSVTFQILSGSSGILNPNQYADVPIKATCPSYGTNGSATAVVTNITTGQVVNVDLSVSCGAPRISDLSPTPLNLVGQLGNTISGNFTFSNTGDGVLTYTTNLGFSNPEIGIRISSGGTGSVQPDQTATVSIAATCPSQPVKDTNSIYVGSNDLLRPTVSGLVKVECVSQIHATLTFAVSKCTMCTLNRVSVRNPLGVITGYYWERKGNMVPYGSGGTAYYRFRGGTGVRGDLVIHPFNCRSSTSMANVFRTPEVDKELGDCQTKAQVQAFNLAIPVIYDYVEAHRTEIKLYPGEELIGLRIDKAFNGNPAILGEFVSR